MPKAAYDRLTLAARHLLAGRHAWLLGVADDEPDIISLAALEDPPPLSFDLPLYRDVLTTNRLIAINVEACAVHALGASASIGAPIRSPLGDAVGVLIVVADTVRLWSDHDGAILTQLCAAVAVELALDHETQARMRAESALQDSETRLASVVDHLPGLIFERRKVSRASSVYTFFGGSKQRLPGVAAMLKGDSLGFIHPEDRQRFHETIANATIAETDVALTFRALDPDGSIRWLRSQSVVRRDANGDVVWDGLCFDISDLVTAREAAEAARVANEMLLVDVNHELRAPLQAIIGLTEALRTETRPQLIQSHAKTIQCAGVALLSIVDQLLDLAWVDGAPVVQHAPTPIVSLVKTCLSLVAPLALEKHIESHLVMEANCPDCLMVDGPKVQQILVNLLTNAIKHTEVGSVTLHVSYATGMLRLRVTDTGVGIADDKKALLFQRFPRIEPDSRASRDLGLGLVIAKQLVERMSGTIGVDSALAKGTTFWFEVPAQVVQDTDASAVDEHEPPTGARILLADDLDLNQKLISDMLSMDGHHIDCVSNGAEAVRAAESGLYDLILMDMIMPVMDGLTATRAIRALPAPACNVTIIALTAHSFKEQLDSCIAAGMNATITKPMSLDTLTKTVRSWTGDKPRAA